MTESSSRDESLYARIQQLEQERDDLHKEIEQLCMQRAGPDYIAVATQMHIRRTAGLEQEIEHLKKRLASYAKENSDLKKELSDVKRINVNLEQLHKREVTKNTEAVKELDVLRGAVSTASAELDQAMKEAVKAKENEDIMSQKLNDAKKRLQELTSGSVERQEQLTSLHIKLAKQEQQLDMFRKIIHKFYKIRQHACRGIWEEESGWDMQSGSTGWDDKCACLYNDPPEAWSFNVHREASTANYVAALKEQLETLRCSVDDYRDKLEKILSSKLLTDGVSSLREYHAQQRIQTMDILNDGKSYLEAVVVSVEEKLGYLSADSSSAVVAEGTSGVSNVGQLANPSKAVAQALKEKVSALLLLSQQEESHLLEVRTALRGTLDELQRHLKQATGEKVDALMELAQVKQEYQQLLERTIQERQGSHTDSSERRIIVADRDGKLKNLLKKTSFKLWLSTKENTTPAADPQVGHEGSLTSSRSNLSMDDARLQIENATLKDNIRSLKCLTSNIHKLRDSLMQAKETPASEGMRNKTLRVLDEIFWEAELVKNALGAPFWSGEGDMASSGDVIFEVGENPLQKMDSVSAAGLEMVELLILAAQVIKEKMGK